APNAGQQFAPAQRRSPATPLEEENSAQVRVRFQKRSQRRVEPPIDFALRQMEFEQAQNGQGLDDIPKRTRFENEDFQEGGWMIRDGNWRVQTAIRHYRLRITATLHLPSASRSARRGGRPAAMILACAAGMS